MVEWKVPGAAADTAEFELYDYQADPLETVNVADSRPDVLMQLRTILATHPEPRPQQKSGQTENSSAEKNSSTKPRKTPQDRVTMFRKRDKNNDGVLSREEFLTGQPDPDEAPKRFPRFDKNGNGVLDQTEFVTSGKQADENP